MDPQRRREWADAWSKWVRPGGVLVTLMFPMEPEGREGPPWPVSAEAYRQVLDNTGTLEPCQNLMSVPSIPGCFLGRGLRQDCALLMHSVIFGASKGFLCKLHHIVGLQMGHSAALLSSSI